MGPVDVIVIIAILLIVGGASYYIWRSKKSGRKCIGCPDSASCKSCGGCGCHCQHSAPDCDEKEG